MGAKLEFLAFSHFLVFFTTTLHNPLHNRSTLVVVQVAPGGCVDRQGLTSPDL